MTGLAARARRPRQPLARVLALAVTLACGAASAQAPADPAAGAVANSSLDAPLFYQLLIGEIELRAGHAGNAFEVLLDAARRQGDEALYQRAVDIALQARAGDQALVAVQAWRKAKPASVAPLRYHTQILLALDRTADSAEPLAAWLAVAPAAERPGLIAGLPRLLQRLSDRAQALAMVTKLVAPYRDLAETRSPSLVALGRMHLAAGDSTQALAMLRNAAAADSNAAGPVMLALDMLPATAEAEPFVTRYLARPDAEAALRLAYVRTLTQSQRYGEASQQLQQLTREQPKLAEPWLTLGALHLELKRPGDAEAALQQYLSLAAEAPAATAANASAAANADSDDEAPDDDDHGGASNSGITQAHLLLAQAAEQRGDVKAAEAWLAKVDNPQRLLEVQSRRASLLAKQGKVKEARALIQSVPERTGDDARGKAIAEAQLLRDIKRWQDAADVLAAASKRFADDTELIYEQAMVAEKLERLPEMEQLLRRVIALKPDHPHAHNALGYSLADRGQRLPEARDLIRRALELSPGDPFITDSLGWVEFRMGNNQEALRLLRLAYNARPDTEIAAHLGEVLWAIGQQEAARNVWREARGRDAGNEVLSETLTRLKVGL